jgi:ABC-2 type transport system ATP-binding protein
MAQGSRSRGTASVAAQPHSAKAGRPAVGIQGLEKTFATKRRGAVQAVQGIDLEIAEGEAFAFLGPNGAGKTTTLKILTTLLRPSAGRVEIAGIDVVAHPDRVRRTIGVALQEAGLDPAATAWQLLTFQAQLQGISGRAARERAEELLAIVGLSESADRRTGTLSGGMRRRLDLASALVHRPGVLFLDEPTTGLDPASRRDVWAEVRRLNTEEGMTVFLTTQYLEEADELAHRVAIIDQGRIVADGPPERLKAEVGADVIHVEVPSEHTEPAREALRALPDAQDMGVDATGVNLYVADGPGRVAEALRRLDSAGVPVAAITVSRPSLDDAFLLATGHRMEN